MLSGLWYLVFEVVGVTALLLFASTVVVSHRKSRNAWLLALVSLSSACYLLNRMAHKSDAAYQLDLGVLLLPVQVLMNAGAGFWALFCCTTFQDRARIPNWLLVLFGAQLLLSLARALALPMNLGELDRVQPGLATRVLLLALPLFLQALLGVLALTMTVKGWSGDLVNSRRTLRVVSLAYFGALLGGVMLAELALPMATASQRYLMNDCITLAAAFSACGLIIAAARVDNLILGPPGPSVAKPVAPVGKSDYERFRDVFEDQRAWLQHGLSIAGLAQQMGLPQYRLRQLINTRLGYRNFNALLHDYRIKEACRLLADPDKRDLPVLTVALSLGYQSISPFNQAFRELVGQTPTSYRVDRGKIPS